MFDPLDPLFMFACFGDDEDLTCPYCQANLTVTSEEGQVGSEVFIRGCFFTKENDAKRNSGLHRFT